jgi:hypothetical protein
LRGRLRANAIIDSLGNNPRFQDLINRADTPRLIGSKPPTPWRFPRRWGRSFRAAQWEIRCHCMLGIFARSDSGALFHVNRETHSRRLPALMPVLISVAGRLQPSQKYVSPYCDETALKPCDIVSMTITAPMFFGCVRLATPANPQLGHLKPSVQRSNTAMMTSIRARAANGFSKDSLHKDLVSYT